MIGKFSFGGRNGDVFVVLCDRIRNLRSWIMKNVVLLRNEQRQKSNCFSGSACCKDSVWRKKTTRCRWNFDWMFVQHQEVADFFKKHPRMLIESVPNSELLYNVYILENWQGILKMYSYTHRIHIWYSYLHLVDIDGFHVGKYDVLPMDPMGWFWTQFAMLVGQGFNRRPY